MTRGKLTALSKYAYDASTRTLDLLLKVLRRPGVRESERGTPAGKAVVKADEGRDGRKICGQWARARLFKGRDGGNGGHGEDGGR
jgi:hypothetical protein